MMNKSRIGRRGALALGAGGFAGLMMPMPLSAQSGTPGRINIVTTAGNNGQAFIDIMHSQGFLSKYGLDAEFITAGDGTKIVVALLSGSADLCRAGGFGQVLAAIDRGAEMKVVGGAILTTAVGVYSANPDVRTLKDLEGRTVGAGAPGALLHQLMVAVMQKRGVDVGKVDFVNIGSSSQVLKAVVAGRVDAGPCQNDVHYQQAKYGIHCLSELWTDLPEYPYQAAYASTRALNGKRDTVVRCMAAFKEFYDFIQSDAGEGAYIDAFVRLLGEPAAQDAADQWRFFNQYKPFDIEMPVERIEYLQRLNIEMGVQTDMIPLDRIIDMSIAEDAIRLIG
ncbi:ABC transporter substrate-binding protein [Sinirhodobacter populi]|nr:ABC transporter substrate-binding protein [Sinirhodobacter populi]